jgi:hypothetical protein
MSTFFLHLFFRVLKFNNPRRLGCKITKLYNGNINMSAEIKSTDARCNCRHCDGPLAFDPANAGEIATCPHCKLDTMLFIPPPPPVGIVPGRERMRCFVRSIIRQMQKHGLNPWQVSFVIGIVAIGILAPHMFPPNHQTIHAQNPFPAANSELQTPNSAIIKWQYATIEWEPQRFDHVEHRGQILTSFIHIPGDKLFDALYGQRGAAAVGIEKLLNVIGNYGWELVCFDGRQYIVKRTGDAIGGTFYITDEWEDLPKKS